MQFRVFFTTVPLANPERFEKKISWNPYVSVCLLLHCLIEGRECVRSRIDLFLFVVFAIMLFMAEKQLNERLIFINRQVEIYAIIRYVLRYYNTNNTIIHFHQSQQYLFNETQKQQTFIKSHRLRHNRSPPLDYSHNKIFNTILNSLKTNQKHL